MPTCESEAKIKNYKQKKPFEGIKKETRKWLNYELITRRPISIFN